jgi:hypothetical protein
MAFTHYPKTVKNVVLAWVQPPPPDVAREAGRPDFLGRPFSELNRFREPVGPGGGVVGYHDAQPFTRFYGSVACSASLEVTISFSNDEVAPDGHWVTDDNISALHYDAEALKQLYDPQKAQQTSRFFVTIFGRWLRVGIKNVSETPTEFMRVFVRGSVF